MNDAFHENNDILVVVELRVVLLVIPSCRWSRDWTQLIGVKLQEKDISKQLYGIILILV